MLSCQNWPVGICTWSLGNDITVLEQAMIASGMTHLHLSLDPALSADNRDYLNSIEKNQWQPTASMISFSQEDYSTLETIKKTGGIVPDQHWVKNKEKFYKPLN